jgi:glycine dehydrogenase
MIQIRAEAQDIITGKQPKDNNLLKNAPHPVSVIAQSEEEWNRFVCFIHLCIGC